MRKLAYLALMSLLLCLSSSAQERTTTDVSLGYSYIRANPATSNRSEEHTSELQSQSNLVCRLLLEKKTPAVALTMGLRKNRFVTAVQLTTMPGSALVSGGTPTRYQKLSVFLTEPAPPPVRHCSPV